MMTTKSKKPGSAGGRLPGSAQQTQWNSNTIPDVGETGTVTPQDANLCIPPPPIPNVERQSMLDRALYLAEAGFHIFPLGGHNEHPPLYFIERFKGTY